MAFHDRPQHNSERPVNLEPLALTHDPRRGIIGQQPIRTKLLGQRDRVGLAEIEQAGIDPSLSPCGEGLHQPPDCEPVWDWVEGSQLVRDGRRNEDLTGLRQKIQQVGFMEVEQRPRVAGRPPQALRSLSPVAQRMSSR